MGSRNGRTKNGPGIMLSCIDILAAFSINRWFFIKCHCKKPLNLAARWCVRQLTPPIILEGELMPSIPCRTSQSPRSFVVLRSYPTLGASSVFSLY